MSTALVSARNATVHALDRIGTLPLNGETTPLAPGMFFMAANAPHRFDRHTRAPYLKSSPRSIPNRPLTAFSNLDYL